MNYIFVADKNEIKHLKHFANTKLILTGVGATNTIKTLSRFLRTVKLSSQDKFFNVGYCGTNYDHLQIGDICKVSYSRIEHKSIYVPEKEIKLCRGGINCYSSNDFVTNSKHIGIFDMELYTLATIFPKIQSYKIVSDKLDFSIYKQINKNGILKSWQELNNLLSNSLK